MNDHYSHAEIEAACGGEIAQLVRTDVMKRRAAIDAELAGSAKPAVATPPTPGSALKAAPTAPAKPKTRGKPAKGAVVAARGVETVSAPAAAPTPAPEPASARKRPPVGQITAFLGSRTKLQPIPKRKPFAGQLPAGKP